MSSQPDRHWKKLTTFEWISIWKVHHISTVLLLWPPSYNLFFCMLGPDAIDMWRCLAWRGRQCAFQIRTNDMLSRETAVTQRCSRLVILCYISCNNAWYWIYRKWICMLLKSKTHQYYNCGSDAGKNRIALLYSLMNQFVASCNKVILHSHDRHIITRRVVVTNPAKTPTTNNNNNKLCEKPLRIHRIKYTAALSIEYWCRHKILSN